MLTPISSRLLDAWALKMLHEKNWRESLYVLEFLSSTKFSLNSCSHSGMSEYNGSPRSFNNGSPRSFCGSFLKIGFWEFYWLGPERVMDPVISVQNKNFSRNTKELAEVLGADQETKSHLHCHSFGIGEACEAWNHCKSTPHRSDVVFARLFRSCRKLHLSVFEHCPAGHSTANILIVLCEPQRFLLLTVDQDV